MYIPLRRRRYNYDSYILCVRFHSKTYIVLIELTNFYLALGFLTGLYLTRDV